MFCISTRLAQYLWVYFCHPHWHFFQAPGTNEEIWYSHEFSLLMREFWWSLRLRLDQCELLNSKVTLSECTGLHVIPKISHSHLQRWSVSSPTMNVCVASPSRGTMFPCCRIWSGLVTCDQQNVKKKNDLLGLLSPDLKRPGSFCFLLLGSQMPWKKSHYSSCCEEAQDSCLENRA